MELFLSLQIINFYAFSRVHMHRKYFDDLSVYKPISFFGIITMSDGLDR